LPAQEETICRQGRPRLPRRKGTQQRIVKVHTQTATAV
jgi:hypothetical protein